MPNPSTLKDLLAKALGYPSLIRRIQAPIILRMLDLKENDVVLDAGCGSGYFTSEIAQKSQLSIGVDLKLKERLALILSKQSGKMYAAADIQRLPFADQVFNKILLSSVLQVVDDASLMRECYRVLKSEGIVVLTVPIEYYYFTKLNEIKPELGLKADAKGKAYYESKELARLLENNGFRILELEYSPKKLGSLVCEMEVYLWHRFKLPFLSSIAFPLFYSLLFFEHRADRRQRGNELIVKAQKKVPNSRG